MMCQAILLLSDDAAMNNKPELEIFADDVACGHGATVGALDPEQIFYMESRGMPQTQTQKRCCSRLSARKRSTVVAEPELCAKCCCR